MASVHIATSPEQGFLSSTEAASYLRVSKSYLYRLTSTGKIRHFKPSGKTVYFRQSDLDEYIMSFEVKPLYEVEAEAARMVARVPRKGQEK